MKKPMKIGALCLTVMALATPVTSAGVIERACKKMDRKAATPSTCRCVQRVANKELSRSDRRKAAKFFKDPHLAQVARQSDNRSTEEFWLRYKSFGKKAGQVCS
jgi:hypothetical protein